jgi:hypothetical protein
LSIKENKKNVYINNLLLYIIKLKYNQKFKFIDNDNFLLIELLKLIDQMVYYYY